MRCPRDVCFTKIMDIMMAYLKNTIFSEIKIGDAAQLSRVLTKKDILFFAIVSGDVNPAHVDEEFAKNDFFHQIVGHGMWTGALISTLLGTKLPGPGTIYLSQTLKFMRPVLVGDEITATVKVIKKWARKPFVLFQCTCVNQRGKEVMTGKAKVLAPTKNVKVEPVELPKLTLVEE